MCSDTFPNSMGNTQQSLPFNVDTCYDVCGIEKSDCDSVFQQCLTSMCASSYGHNPKCIGAATFYVTATQLFGQGYFDLAQVSSCECVPSAGARGHYESLLLEFYERFAPRSRDEAISTPDVVAALVRAMDGTGLPVVLYRGAITSFLCIAGSGIGNKPQLCHVAHTPHNFA